MGRKWFWLRKFILISKWKVYIWSKWTIIAHHYCASFIWHQKFIIQKFQILCWYKFCSTLFLLMLVMHKMRQSCQLVCIHFRMIPWMLNHNRIVEIVFCVVLEVDKYLSIKHAFQNRFLLSFLKVFDHYQDHLRCS